VIQCAAIRRVLNVPAEMVDGVRTLTIKSRRRMVQKPSVAFLSEIQTASVPMGR
jgi:hypothetical protein